MTDRKQSGKEAIAINSQQPEGSTGFSLQPASGVGMAVPLKSQVQFQPPKPKADD